MAKQYFMEYESDIFDKQHYDIEKQNYGSFFHVYGANASTVKTAKGYILKVKKEKANENPRNFKIYDSWAEVDEKTKHVPCVYHED